MSEPERTVIQYYRGRRPKRLPTWIVIPLAAIATAVAISVYYVPHPDHVSSSHDPEQRTLSHLDYTARKLWMAVRSYAHTHGGNAPRSLEDMLDCGLLVPSDVELPTHGFVVPNAAHSPSNTHEKNLTYIGAQDLIAFDPRPYRFYGRECFFVISSKDHAELLNFEELDARLKQLGDAKCLE